MFSSTGRIQAVTLEVNQGNSTCIKAELTASFSITYNTSNSTVWTMTTTICFPLLKPILLILYPHEHQLYPLSLLREQCRSLFLTPPPSMQAAVHAAQTETHHGWWRCSDLAMHWG